jgi:hypothetical protein
VCVAREYKRRRSYEISQRGRSCIHLKTYGSLFHRGHGPVQHLTNSHTTTNHGIQVVVHRRRDAGLRRRRRW